MSESIDPPEKGEGAGLVPEAAPSDSSSSHVSTASPLPSQGGYSGDGPPPRWRKGSRGGTAQAAARHTAPKAPTLRMRVLALIEEKADNPEGIFDRLKAEGVKTVLTSVRPRTTELANLGLVKDSGRRALGESGVCKSIVWEATSPEERAAFAARKAAEAEKEDGQ